MFRPLASFLHRSGIVSYLRRTWRADDTQLREQLKAEIARQVAESLAPLTATVSELRGRQRTLRRELQVLAANSRHGLAVPPDATDFDLVERHASAAMASATLETSPMPHVVIRNLLPDTTYRALIAAMPPDEYFPARDPVKQNFRPSRGDLVPEFTEKMWRFLEDDIVARVLAPGLMSRLSAPIEAAYTARYGDRAASVSALPHGATAGRLMLRRPGYHLEPHLDPRRVVVTCLIYFARPGDDASFGTQLFSVKGLTDINQSKTFYPREAGYECTLEKTVPFTPNTALAFLNAGAAAHGASISASAPEGTKRYAYQFYLSPNPAGLAEITGEMADAHPA